MKNGHIGIVLRIYTGKNKIALLDAIKGRIDGGVFSSSVCVGAVLRYQIAGRHDRHLLDAIEIEDIPFALARSDLLFLHHVLEICYYFIPIGSCVAGVFELLQFLYTVDYSSCGMQCKKLFLLKLLVAIGFYPELPQWQEQGIQQLLALPIDIVAHEPIDLAIEKMIDDWLSACIAQHPRIEQFNTVHFLTKNRLV